METVITDSDKSNPKLYWKILKQLIKSNKSSETIPPFQENQEKSNCLNDYFASISTVDDSKVSFPNFIPKTNNSLLYFQITETEIAEMIET